MTPTVAPSTVGRRALEAVGVDVATVPEVGGRPVAPPGSRVVMAFPDVLGRIVQPHPDHVLIAVVDRMVGDTVEVGTRHVRVDVGAGLGPPGALVAALVDLAKRTTTSGGVRLVTAAPYAVPVLAPDADVDVPPWCESERPAVGGLPDLVVLRPARDPRWRGRRLRPPRLTVR